MPSTPPQRARPSSDLAEALLKVKGTGELTTAAYQTALKAFLASAHPVTVEGFASYIHGLRRTRSAATVNQALAAGRKAFLQAAERLGLPAKEISLIRGALGEIPAVKKAPPEVTVVSPEERIKLLEALPLRVRLVAETLYVTGARVSEILGTRRDQVRINGTVELRLYGKGGKERSSRIPAELYRRILGRVSRGHVLVLLLQGTALPSGVHIQGDRAGSAAGPGAFDKRACAEPLTGDRLACGNAQDQGGLEAARPQ